MEVDVLVVEVFLVADRAWSGVSLELSWVVGVVFYGEDVVAFFGVDLEQVGEEVEVPLPLMSQSSPHH